MPYLLRWRHDSCCQLTSSVPLWWRKRFQGFASSLTRMQEQFVTRMSPEVHARRCPLLKGVHCFEAMATKVSSDQKW